MPKLTDTQLVILTGAAKREDGAVLPLPESLTLNKGAATSVLKNLLKKGLIAERPATTDDEMWREDDDRRLTLAISNDGLMAIGVEPDDESTEPGDMAPANEMKSRKAESGSSKSAAPEPQPPTTTIRPGTKQALLIDLLNRKAGATIPEIMEATGWQAHSVRGAISGALKKKLGLKIISEPIEDRGRVYRIAEAA